MRRLAIPVLVLLSLLVFRPELAAQEEPESRRGWLWTFSFSNYTYPRRTLPPDATGQSPGTIRARTYAIDNSIGYRFSRLFAVTTDIPLYLARFCQTDNAAITTCGSNNGFGDIGFSARISLEGKVANFYSTGTVFLPTGSTSRGLGAGSTTAAWTNTANLNLWTTTPFVSVTIANSLLRTASFLRPFASKGLVYEVSGGLEHEFHRLLRVGGLLYAVFPSGTQTTFGRLRRGPGPVPIPTPPNVPQQGRTTASEALTRDNGASSWLRFPFHDNFQLQIAYTRSVRLDLNVVSWGFFINFSPLLPKP